MSDAIARERERVTCTTTTTPTISSISIRLQLARLRVAFAVLSPPNSSVPGPSSFQPIYIKSCTRPRSFLDKDQRRVITQQSYADVSPASSWTWLSKNHPLCLLQFKKGNAGLQYALTWERDWYSRHSDRMSGAAGKPIESLCKSNLC